LELRLDFDVTLLAEVLVSRRLLSKGHLFLDPSGYPTHKCSSLEIALCEYDAKSFRKAEEEILSGSRE